MSKMRDKVCLEPDLYILHFENIFDICPVLSVSYGNLELLLQGQGKVIMTVLHEMGKKGILRRCSLVATSAKTLLALLQHNKMLSAKQKLGLLSSMLSPGDYIFYT